MDKNVNLEHSWFIQIQQWPDHSWIC